MINLIGFYPEYLSDDEDMSHKYQSIEIQGLSYEWYQLQVDSTSKDIIFWKRGEGFDYLTFEKNILLRLQKEYSSKEFISIYNDYREFDTPFKYIPALSWWGLVLSSNWHKIKDIKNISNTHQREKLFLSRNRKSKDHRIKFVSFLRQNGLFDRGYVSVGWENKFIENLEETHLLNPTLKGVPYERPAHNDFNLLEYYSNVFCEVVTESGCHPIVHDDPELTIKQTPFGYFDSEKVWRPFMMCVIPMIITYPNYDDYLKDAGFDMFDDVIDTSFYKIEDLDEKNRIIKNNLEVIENDLTINGRFRDSIWDRLKKNQEHFIDYKNYYKYVRDKING
jgi:hypothetical protein|tara:strand:+ start:276 stop:1280 length:1005 start_codon:yes stop_codon:yes gene_type:complete